MENHLKGGSDMNSGSKSELATLGGGCFWCLDPIFADLRGVENVVVGYAGGKTKNPTYEQVCYTNTGHAEVVQITFRPEEISFREILEVFFAVHDPTTLNRQGADVGTQYRSIILAHDEAQRQTAEELIQELNGQGVWKTPIVTQVVPYDTFYLAEEYHQQYFKKNPYAGYCQVVIRPKVDKFHKHYQALVKAKE